MVHTTGGSEKTDGGNRPRARSGGGRRNAGHGSNVTSSSRTVTRSRLCAPGHYSSLFSPPMRLLVRSRKWRTCAESSSNVA